MKYANKAFFLIAKLLQNYCKKLEFLKTFLYYKNAAPNLVKLKVL